MEAVNIYLDYCEQNTETWCLAELVGPHYNDA